MKKMHIIMLASAGIALSALATANPVPKFKVTEVVTPLESDPNCLPGYAIRVTGGGVSDRGLVPGGAICYSVSDVSRQRFPSCAGPRAVVRMDTSERWNRGATVT